MGAIVWPVELSWEQNISKGKNDILTLDFTINTWTLFLLLVIFKQLLLEKCNKWFVLLTLKIEDLNMYFEI